MTAPLPDRPSPESGARWRAPGLDAVNLEARDGDAFVARLSDGERATVTLAPGLSPALVEECLENGRMMLVRYCEDVPILLGALQTEPSALRQRDGVVTLRGRDVRVEAEQQLHLEAGATRLSIDPRGKLQLVGERLTMQVASLIKLIAAKVELP